MTSKAQLKANKKYDKENTKIITIKINKNTESEILKMLESVDNKNGYIKQLILNDILLKNNQ